ncbi:hypothetical protein [Bacteroides heparinolyticus]|uniref:hypothetical protein n=1 Tax=Prevotella heparinolytica TaxID=28113 RepID=UPI00359F26CE
MKEQVNPDNASLSGFLFNKKNATFKVSLIGIPNGIPNPYFNISNYSDTPYLSIRFLSISPLNNEKLLNALNSRSFSL